MISKLGLLFVICWIAPTFSDSYENNQLIVKRDADELEGSGEDSISTTTSIDASTSSIGAALMFQEDEEPDTMVRRCSPLHYNICNKRIQKEHETCMNSCKSVLGDLWPNDNVTECFDPMTELKKWDECLENGAELTTDEYPPPLLPRAWVLPFHYTAADELQGLREQSAGSAGGVWLKKARHSFAALRQHQHCYVGCMKRFERTCHALFACAVPYPRAADLRVLMRECPGFGRLVLETAKRACRCLSERHHVLRLVGQCHFMGNRMYMRRF